LMYKGVYYLTASTGPLLSYLADWRGSVEEGALILMIAALVVGHLKGRMVLSKSVMRMVGHVRALSTPAPLWKIYPS